MFEDGVVSVALAPAWSRLTELVHLAWCVDTQPIHVVEFLKDSTASEFPDDHIEDVGCLSQLGFHSLERLVG